MSEVHRLPDVSVVEREASEWIARLNADDVSVHDRARFEAWRAGHPLRARIYQDLWATWRQFTAAGPFVRAVCFAHSMKEVGAERPPLRRRFVAAAAASIIVVVASTWLYVTRLTPGTPYETSIGEHASIALPDGSTLELNSNSAARVIYSKAERVIRLERGEAYFSVAHNTQRPFWVVGGGSWVRAVGTAFDVDLRATGVVVTVSEGTVNVGAADASVADVPSNMALTAASMAVLTAGQQANLRRTVVATRKLSSTEIAHSVGWREGTLYFENRPLKEVIEELSRYTALKIDIEDESLNALLVGGTFQASPEGSEAMLKMLERGFGLHIRREGDQAYIQAAPTHPHQKGG
jgi:transmembrane sensor